jgi:hypothetical protein
MTRPRLGTLPERYEEASICGKSDPGLWPRELQLRRDQARIDRRALGAVSAGMRLLRLGVSVDQCRLLGSWVLLKVLESDHMFADIQRERSDTDVSVPRIASGIGR